MRKREGRKGVEMERGKKGERGKKSGTLETE